MAIFDESVIQRRTKAAAEALSHVGSPVIIAAGEPVSKPGGLDQTYPFLPLPEYYWLTGSRRSGGYMAYEPGKGWIHFVRKADPVELLWEGTPEVPAGTDAKKIDEWLRAHSGESIAVLGNASGTPFASLPQCPALEAVREALDKLRRIKDEAELALIVKAVSATEAAFKRAREVIKPGVTEREVQVELEAQMRRHGADGTSFGTIVGAGTHAAVLHFEPGSRVIGADDLVLVDSGAEICEYSSDVTRTYPAGTRFTAEQQAIYDVVLAGQKEGISKCRVGEEWHAVHKAAAAVMAQGLKDCGILRGSVDELLETGAIALFFPHGLGHMLGLRVRDVGGKVPSRPDGRMCCGARVRVDLPLEAGFVMTVEPGIYFVPAILDDAQRREKYKNAVAWDVLENWRKVGGVRIEDDILITPQGAKNLTHAIPK